VGPYINGYAFGDIDQLIPIIERVQKEEKTVPDLTNIYPGVAFKPKSEWDAGKDAASSCAFAPKTELSCGGRALRGCSGRLIAEQRATTTHENRSAVVLPRRM
jgi:hypothetical protein